MKQKTQGRELSALVPASFDFSDYDEYAAVSYSFALRILGQYIPSIPRRIRATKSSSP